MNSTDWQTFRDRATGTKHVGDDQGEGTARKILRGVLYYLEAFGLLLLSLPLLFVFGIWYILLTASYGVRYARNLHVYSNYNPRVMKTFYRAHIKSFVFFADKVTTEIE